jgi:hypothetical protein
MTPFVAVNEKIGVARSPPGEGVEKQIGTFIAENLVDNGATLQMGIGGIPDACLAALKGHKDLGIHSEMFSDGVMELYDSGVITNAKKRHKPGYIVSGTRCTCAVVCSGVLAGLRLVPPQASFSGQTSCTSGATTTRPSICAILVGLTTS